MRFSRFALNVGLCAMLFATTRTAIADDDSNEPLPLPPPPTATPAQLKSAVEALSAELEPELQKTQRPFYVYHYVDKKKLGLADSEPVRDDEARVKNHLEDWSRFFFNPARAGEDFHAGLYAATDPLSSRDYGNRWQASGTLTNTWVLYRLEIPQATRYLDPHASGEHSWKPETFSKIQAAGCKINSDAEGQRKLLNAESRIGRDCFDIVTTAYERLGVSMLSGRWEASPLSGCKTRPQTMFVVIDLPPIHKMKGVAVFSTEGEASPERAMTERLFTDPLARGRFSAVTPEDKLWPALDATPPSDQDFVDWKRVHLMGCENATLASQSLDTRPSAPNPCPPVGPTVVTGVAAGSLQAIAPVVSKILPSVDRHPPASKVK